MKTSFYGMLLAFLLLTGQAWAENPQITQYKLDNGLTVVLCEKHEIPTVFGGVITRVGSKDDPADATGLAHYMEHMLFKGTTEMGTTDWEAEKPYIDSIFALYDLLGETSEQSGRDEIQMKINALSVKAGEYAIPNEIDNLLRSMGSTGINAGTASDWTAYYNQFPPSALAKWLTLYAHRFEEPVFRLFQSELETVYEEKNMYSDVFFYPMFEEFLRNLYKVHPYGQQTALGTMEHLKNPSLSRMKEFYDAWYAPGNMALVLIGDFDSDQAKSMIEETFGTWKARPFPKHAEWTEEPLNGREFVEVKMSPIKMEMLGFRTIPTNHPDKVVMDVCNYLISNEGGTGLLDKLVQENQLLEAQMFTMPNLDLQSTILFVVPKLVGQSLDEAEQLALAELKKLATGEFSDALLQIAKMEITRDYKLELEDHRNLGIYMIDSWYNDEPVEELFAYPEKVAQVSREDIIRFASKYYGENYLAFHSKMGSAEKEKIDKPGFDPVQGDREAKSKFATYLETVPELENRSSFVDFDQDISRKELTNGNTLYAVRNPENDIFTLKIKYGIGTTELPLLNEAARLMNYAGTEGISLDSLKKSFALLGTTYSFGADKNYVTVSLTGPDKYFEQALTLISQVVEDPQIDPVRIEKVVEEVKAERKVENEDADAVADALLEYAMFGDRSTFLYRTTIKDLKKSEVEDLVNAFGKALNYQAEIHYAGGLDPGEAGQLLANRYSWTEKPLESLAPDVRDLIEYPGNNLIIVDKPKATQSKIYFYTPAADWSTDQQASCDAFNFYFGGGFSGLVLQEIRESRSLAYSAGAKYGQPPLEGEPAFFYGYIGTQDDKTVEAVSVFTDLVRNMPEKPERMDYMRKFLVQNSYSSRPGFRDMSETVVRWENLGYTSDPNEMLSKKFEAMEFADLVKFYEENLKDLPLTVCIVGDADRMNTDALGDFGKVSMLKEKKLYSK